MSAHILVVDDEPEILRALGTTLRAAGYEIETAATGEDALARAGVRPPDGVIVDLVLPGKSGVEVCRELRKTSDAAILVLSVVGDEADKVAALDAGADDYLVKPCAGPELLARVRAVLRRTERGAAGSPSGSATAGAASPADWMVDHSARCLRRGALALPLRPKEYDLLCTLWARRGEIVSRGELLRAVWGYADDVTTRTVDSHIFALRRKLEPTPAQPRYILTVNRAGYRLVA
jgi:DNA-binding response OmpR family regulator